MLGDFNARVEVDATESDVLGRYGFGTRDDWGQHLIDFCDDHKLVLTNTMFRNHQRRRYTWKQPGDRSRSQIDYIAVKSQWKKSIKNVKTIPGADIESDHNLLVAELCMKFNSKRQCNEVIMDVKQLQDRQLQEAYQVEVTNRFEALNLLTEDRTPNSMWNNIKDAIIASAKEILPKQKQKKKV